jgi:hypothetical protein
VKARTMIEPHPIRNRMPWSAIGALALLSTVTSTARATPPTGESDPTRQGPDRVACVGAHHDAQELRKAGKLVEAGKKLAICASASCPGVIVSDCGTWTSELEQATPSMSFEVEVDGHTASSAKVSVDGLTIADWSHPVVVDPGNHLVRVEAPSFEPHEETIFMAEGHRMRLVSVKFETPKPAHAASVSPERNASLPEDAPRPVPVIVYPLLAGAGVGLVGFGVLAGLGRAKQSDLQNRCEPHCTTSDLAPMKTEYLVGDIALGVGAAALVGAAVVYLTRPHQDSTSPSSVSFSVGPAGVDANRRTVWAASATRSW